MIRSALFLCSGLLLFLAAACTSNSNSAAEETAAAPAVAAELPGKALYTQNCAVCHGPDGKLGLNGAHDLTKSNLNATGRVYMVTQGLGKMPSFKNQLSPEQIQQVVDYSLTLK
ncbi:c-type cytochrome [Hymenobacter cellulosivorans]|uniref:Cytochrome c n=1 Tax=Hymenobacter cellulosivorans TaxID=2932249 RepID=A0ABY4FA85_9BACT|nr:cytochrome c [Hymenobacter cellulosivorans]UOQ53587.1 cytochrome c [Hymenobacter cellulosivorans]